MFRSTLYDLGLCHCYMYCNIKFNVHLHYRICTRVIPESDHRCSMLSTGTDHEFQIYWFITVYCVVYVNESLLDSRQPREWMAAVKYARGWFLNLITAVLCCQQNKIIHQSANWCDFNTTQTHTTLLQWCRDRVSGSSVVNRLIGDFRRNSYRGWREFSRRSCLVQYRFCPQGGVKEHVSLLRGTKLWYCGIHLKATLAYFKIIAVELWRIFFLSLFIWVNNRHWVYWKVLLERLKISNLVFFLDFEHRN